MNIAEVIKNFCEDYDYTFYSDYSGRCMYGRHCVGIVCDNTLGALLELADYIKDNYEDEYSYTELLGSPCMDSLGLSNILYFPKIEV